MHTVKHMQKTFDLITSTKFVAQNGISMESVWKKEPQMSYFGTKKLVLMNLCIISLGRTFSFDAK